MLAMVDFFRLAFTPEPHPIAEQLRRQADHVVRESDRFGEMIRGFSERSDRPSVKKGSGRPKRR